jgi:uncharacterized protein (DUF1684 family)
MRWLLAVPATLAFAAVTTTSYRSEIDKWRVQREARLKAEDGWLTVSGLFWLKEGPNRVGSDPKATVVLPSGTAPGEVATLTLNSGAVHLNVRDGAPVQVNGKPAKSAQLKTDKDDQADIISVGRVKLFVIVRSGKYAIRMKDPESEYRRGFTGLKWFPVKEEWRLTAKFVNYPQPKKLIFDSMIGEKQEDISPGYAIFQKDGKEYKLEPTMEDNELFFVFRDKTAGKTTYPAARFVKTDMPKDGKITLDFNKAYNPPCVFTPYATCPLPTAMNRLPIPIEAGEMMYDSKLVKH